MMFWSYLALAASLAVTALAFYGLISFSGKGFDLTVLQDDYIQAILLFSLKQASLSAVLSVGLAWPVARALYYLPTLWAKRAFLSLCLLCFVLPAFILITGLVSLLGRSGLLTPYLGNHWNLYGLHGILLAHIFLNMPFALRAMYLQLQTIPQTSWRLARQLKLTPLQHLALLEWPVLKGSLGILLSFIFILCFNSFAVVLALGGGPQSTSLEVAIYQALKYDFNLTEAVTLAWLQFAITGSLFLMMIRWGAVLWLSVDSVEQRWTPLPSLAWRGLYYLCYSAAWLFLLAPLVALIPNLFKLNWQRLSLELLGKATGVTLGLGLSSTALALAIAYSLLLPIRKARYYQQQRRQWGLEVLSAHHLIAPTMVLSVGLYVFFLPQIDLNRWGLGIVAILNAFLLVPFALQQLRPRLFQFDDQYRRLIRLLKLSKPQILQVEWPWLYTTGQATFVLVLLLAMGDVAVFGLFADHSWASLPWLIYSYAGSYRLPEASAVSFILLALCLLLVLWFERQQQAA